MPAPTPKPVDDLVGLNIDEIAARRGVTKRHAYALYTRVNRPPDVPVADNQKTAILTVLDRSDAATMHELQEKVRVIGGVHLDAHSLTHVIWSMQKQRLVRFRERKNESQNGGSALTAIKITPTGRTVLTTLRASLTAAAVIIEEVAEPVDRTQDDSAPSDSALSAQSVPQLADYPRLRLLLERAERAALVREAVALLERAGEDTVALELLERHALSEEEEEMVRLLTALREGDA